MKTLRNILTAAVLFIVGFALRAQGATYLTAAAWGFGFWYAIIVVFTLFERLGLSNLAANYTTYDIMVMAVLVAIGGVLKAYWAQIRMVVESFLGPFSSFIIAPGFYVWGILAAYLVRKPGSGTISMVLGGVVEILAGNPFGVPVLLFNFWEGLGPDIAYGIFRYKKYNLFVAILGGLLASYFGVFYGWYYFGLSEVGVLALLGVLASDTVGGIVAGVVGHYLAVGLERLGVKTTREAIVEPAYE